MKFGIFDHVDRQDVPLAQTYDERFALLERADALNFHCYHIAEHHMTPLGMAPSPNVYLAAAARHTKRLRICPLVYLLPLYDPLRLIEEICMLDHLSHGRLEIGVGRGVSPYELAFYNVPFLETRDKFNELLPLILQGLTNETLDVRGKHYNYYNVPMELRPLQQPAPPLWYGTTNLSSVKMASEYGMNIVSLLPAPATKPLFDAYKEGIEANKDHPNRAYSALHDPLMGLYRLVFVADTDAEAERLAAHAFEKWIDSFRKLWVQNGVVNLAMRGGFEDIAAGGFIVHGSPAKVKAEIEKQKAESGCNYMVFSVAFGNAAHEDVMRSVDLLGTEVMPAFG